MTTLFWHFFSQLCSVFWKKSNLKRFCSLESRPKHFTLKIVLENHEFSILKFSTPIKRTESATTYLIFYKSQFQHIKAINNLKRKIISPKVQFLALERFMTDALNRRNPESRGISLLKKNGEIGLVKIGENFSKNRSPKLFDILSDSKNITLCHLINISKVLFPQRFLNHSFFKIFSSKNANFCSRVHFIKITIVLSKEWNICSRSNCGGLKGIDFATTPEQAELKTLQSLTY